MNSRRVIPPQPCFRPALLAGLLVALAATATAQDKPLATGAPPKLIVESFSHDFGTVEAGYPMSFTFKIKNEGLGELAILSVTPSCGCTTTSFDKVVAPGKEGRIQLQVPNTHGYSGEVAKFAIVTTNDPSNPKFGLTLHAYFKTNPREVPPTPATYVPPVTRVGPFAISPGDKWVTAIIRGSTVPATLTFKNSGPAPAHIINVVPGGDSFKVTLRTVLDGKDYDLNVVTNPTLKPGHYTQTVELSTDTPEAPKIPITLDLTVYPEVIVTPSQIRLPAFPSSADISKIDIPLMYVRKVRGTGLKIESVSSTLSFLRLDTRPELTDQTYVIHASVIERPKPGDYDGVITVRTDDPEAPELKVAVHLSFAQ